MQNIQMEVQTKMLYFALYARGMFFYYRSTSTLHYHLNAKHIMIRSQVMLLAKYDKCVTNE